MRKNTFENELSLLKKRISAPNIEPLANFCFAFGVLVSALFSVILFVLPFSYITVPLYIVVVVFGYYETMQHMKKL